MKQPLRYAVLHHEGIEHPHFDLLLELEPGAALTTWRSDVWPLANKTPLTPLKDHRPEYLTYEGPISGERGFVRRVAGGTYELIHRGRTMLIVRFPGMEPEEWLIADFPGGSVAVHATGTASA